MSKRILAIIISLVMISMSGFVFADSGYGDNNTNADNTITDTIDWLASDTYTIENGFVTGVKVGTTVSTFKSGFSGNASNVSVLNATDSDVLKTGMVVQHSVSNEQCKIAVAGDVNKDGYVTVSDIISLSDHIIGQKEIVANTVEFKAADVNSSGTVTVVDVVNIRKIISSK